MANQMKHTGTVPANIFVVSRQNDNTFWVYIKEGHALNRLLKERGAGHTAAMTRFSAATDSAPTTESTPQATL